MRIDLQYMACAFFDGVVNATWPGPVRLFAVPLGMLHLPTGRLVACDPLAFPDVPPFTRTFPPGLYPVSARVAEIGTDQRVAFATVTFSSEPIAEWQFLEFPDQDPAPLGDDEFYGYPVDAGTGAFMDESARISLEARYASDPDYADFFIAELQKTFVNTWGWTNLTPAPNRPENLIAFHSGYGDGFYPTLVGLSTKGTPVAVVTDFMVFGDSTPAGAV